MIQCSTCQQYFHRDCITCLSKPLLFGDIFGTFKCSVCNDSESFDRKNLSWIVIVHLVIYNLIYSAQLLNQQQKRADKKREHYYFQWKEDVCAFIDDYWDYLLPGKQRLATWNNTIASVLSTHGSIFLSGFEKFKQSAWWTLHKVEPPTGEKKKAASRAKPNLKKPLKRCKKDETPRKTRKLDHGVKIKQEEFDISSLSELSSDEERFSDHEGHETENPKQPREMPRVISYESPSPPPAEYEVKIEKIFEKTRKEQEKREQEMREQKMREQKMKEQEMREHDQKETDRKEAEKREADRKETEKREIDRKEAEKKETDRKEAEKREEERKKVELEKKIEEQKKERRPVTLQTPQEEWLLLQKLEHTSKSLICSATRYKRKLAVRRLRRNLGIKLFDMDQQLLQSLRSTQGLEPISTQTAIVPTANQQEKVEPETIKMPDQIHFTPYVCSFASRLSGAIRQRQTLTRDEAWLSSWNGRKLRPFIRRDFENKPSRMLLMAAIKACSGRPQRQVMVEAKEDSIDYVYFQREHLTQVNQLLSRSFWEGIDVSESLLFPEYSIVALYKRHVIGCAFMTPEAYVTYITVDPGWGNAGIGQFMLYHLFQTAISKDVTLHVSANNNAMVNHR
ncbi:unnamed protein product [Rhizopus stolonifer]